MQTATADCSNQSLLSKYSMLVMASNRSYILITTNLIISLYFDSSAIFLYTVVLTLAPPVSYTKHIEVSFARG
jgi:hypothetical protein